MRVLVVEDEPYMAEAIRDGLRLEAIAADIAGDGDTALELLSVNSYDIAVLDRDIPGPSGDEVAESIVASGSGMPILMLTAADRLDDKATGFGLGADDYLTKPFSFPVLVARLRAVARRGARARPTTLAVGDLVIDPAARRVHRGDTEIGLTAREFAVLAFLARHAGDVVSKRQVLDAVWDGDFEGDPNIVEVYVRHLRNKVDRPFGRDAIQTVRGAGYRLASDGG